MKSQILFVYSSSSAQPFIDAAHKRGHDATLLRDTFKPKHRKMFDRCIAIDINDLEKIKRTVLALHKEKPIKGVVSWFESTQYQAAYIRKILGLQGPTLASALLSHDKFLMREAFRRAGVAQPAYALIKNEREARAAGKKLGFPLIFKPLSGSKSFLVQRVENEQQLLKTFKMAHEAIRTTDKKGFETIAHDPFFRTKKYDPKKFFLLEEVLEGRQFAVTSLMKKNKPRHVAITDLITTKDLNRGGFNLVCRTTPSRLSAKDQRALMALAAKAARAVKITDSAIHPEMILTKKGPKIIEIAARIGGYRAEMTKLAFGIDLADAVIALSLGENPNLNKKYERAASCVEVFPTVTGTVKKVRGATTVSRRPYVKNFQLKRGVGDAVSDIIGKRTIGAVFFVVGRTPEESEQRALDAMNTIHYTIK